MRKVLTLTVLLACAVPARADEKRPNAETRAKTIAPYLDAQTVAVACLDLDRVDPDALGDRLIQLTKAKGQQAGQLERAKREGGQFLDSLKQAGVHEVYVVVSLADMPLTSPTFVLPVRADGDASAVQALLERHHVAEAAAVVGQGVVVGDKRAVERLKSVKPAPRPQLAKAFAAAGTSAFQAALVPSEELRRIASEALPKLPPDLGGGSTRALTRGLDWAVVGLDLPPQSSLHLVVQARDANAARELHELSARVFATVAQLPRIKENVPELEKLLKADLLRVEDTRLVLTLDEPQLVTVLTPLVAQTHAESQRMILSNDLKQIAIAMMNHLDAQRAFPATAIYSKQGKPLLSWRVQLLPYLEQDALYREFHLDEPWDSEHNKKLITRMPKIFAGLNDKVTAEGKTPFVVPVGDATMFPPGPKGVTLASVTDGTSNTILTVMTDDEHSVIWTKPEDLQLDSKEPQVGLNTFNGKGYLVGFADGSVHLLALAIEKANLYALFTRNGGETVNIP